MLALFDHEELPNPTLYSLISGTAADIVKWPWIFKNNKQRDKGKEEFLLPLIGG